jgi:hypothetical protein
MKKARYEEGRLSSQAHGLGTVTREMVEARAREIALINGRSEKQVLDSDLEEARKELLESQNPDPAPSPAESVPEENRWEPVADDSGKAAERIPAPDEQTLAEKLVHEGVEDAEHDQMARAVRAQNRKDKM